MESLEVVIRRSQISYLDGMKILYNYRRHSSGSEDLPYMSCIRLWCLSI